MLLSLKFLPPVICFYAAVTLKSTSTSQINCTLQQCIQSRDCRLAPCPRHTDVLHQLSLPPESPGPGKFTSVSERFSDAFSMNHLHQNLQEHDTFVRQHASEEHTQSLGEHSLLKLCSFRRTTLVR
jgi:hypothetical protein